MLLLPWKLMFFSLLILGSFAAISAPSWISVWMGLEVNILALMALLLSTKSPRNSEAALKYFLIQALASAILISSAFSVSFLFWSNSNLSPFMNFILISLLIKVGSAPFHLWVPQVIEGLTWINNMVVLIWQKFAPFILIAECLEKDYSKNIICSVILLSAIAGALGGLSQTSTRKILAFSSINHIGWMMVGLLFSMNIWLSYYVVYASMLALLIMIFMTANINDISDSKSSFSNFNAAALFTSLLSFGGLPPFTGFTPKWLIISYASKIFPLITLTLIFSSLITLFFYMRIGLLSLINKKQEMINFISSSSLIWSVSFSFNVFGLLVVSLAFSS